MRAPGAHGAFTGRLEVIDGLVYEVDGEGPYWLTEDTRHRRLCRRPDVPTFPADWGMGDPRSEATLTDEDYASPVAYNAIAADGSRLVPGDTVEFLERESGRNLLGTVRGVPGFVSVRTEAGERYDEVSWEDVSRIVVPAEREPEAPGPWLLDRRK